MTEDRRMDLEDIKECIPHRYPFLFIDAVTAIEPGEWAQGYKMVSGNEWFFPGHFPGLPLLPGVISVEALAQLAAVCFLQDAPDDTVGVFSGLDGVKFRRPVRPGDRLDLRIDLVRRRGPFVRVKARASVGEETAVEGTMSFTLLNEEQTE